MFVLEGWFLGEGRGRVEMLGKFNSIDGNRGWLILLRTIKVRVRVYGIISNFV